MAAQLNPYLNFAGKTRNAMEFYQSVFGGELTLTTFGEFGMTDPQVANGIMHSTLAADNGFTLMAADFPPGATPAQGNTMTISLSGTDGDGLHAYWAKLSESGSVTMPLEKQAWGDEFGLCVDRYGTPWMVNIAQS